MFMSERQFIRILARIVGFFALVTVGLAAAGLAAHGAVPSERGPERGIAVTPRVDLDHRFIPVGEAVPVYVMVRFAARAEVPAPGTPRPSLNLALVLDRSGSMADRGKLEYLKRAAAMLIDRLAPRDRLSVVEYDDVITVLWPSAPVEAPRMLKSLIDGLTPRGSTNLVGGMMRGVDEARPNRDPETVTRVLLLSDGLANRGVTDPREIRRLVRGARRDGVAISTLGLGVDYDEDLMQDIAENGGGRYSYIEHPNQMADIFQRELQTLFRTVARGVELRLEPASAVREVEVFGAESNRRDGATVVALDDFYSGEERTLLFRLTVVARHAGPLRLGVVRMAYRDVADAGPREITTDLSVDVTHDQASIDASADGAVTVEVALAEAERRHAEILRHYESGERAAAEAAIDALAGDLAKRNATLGDKRIATKIEALRVERADMSEAMAAPAPGAAMSTYLKRSKQRLYQAKQGKRTLYGLSAGDSGDEVRRLQEALAAAGVYSGPMDGTYDDDVAAAVKAYQDRQGLSADGIAGPATMKEMGLY